jgi:hypothetical protein
LVAIGPPWPFLPLLLHTFGDTLMHFGQGA